jgi:hypothetical protein
LLLQKASYFYNAKILLLLNMHCKVSSYFMIYMVVELRKVIVIAQFVLVPKGKAKGRKIGVTGGYPIIVTLIRYLFIFRDDSPGEMSSVTWGFEKAKVKVSMKSIPSHKSHRSKSPKVLINEAMMCLDVPAQNKTTRKQYLLQVQFDVSAS